MKILTRRKKQEATTTIPPLYKPQVSRLHYHRGFTALVGEHDQGRTAMARGILHHYLGEGVLATVIDLGRGGDAYLPMYEGLTIANKPLQAINALNSALWGAQEAHRLQSTEAAASYVRPMLVIEGYEALIALVPATEHLIKELTGFYSQYVDIVICFAEFTRSIGYPKQQFEPLAQNCKPSMAKVKRRWPHHAEKAYELAASSPEFHGNMCVSRTWGQQHPELIYLY